MPLHMHDHIHVHVFAAGYSEGIISVLYPTRVSAHERKGKGTAAPVYTRRPAKKQLV